MRYLLALAVLLAVPAQAAEIPLKSIHSTTPQEGMKRAKWVNTIGHARERVRIQWRSGASNVFLVDSESIDDAILASRKVLMGYDSAAWPSSSGVSEDKAGKYWLVVFLGISGNKTWIVDSVTIDGKRIRFAYHRRQIPPQGEGGEGVIVHDLYWVPLGELKRGAYQLELFDGEVVTLMRRVEVGLQVP